MALAMFLSANRKCIAVILWLFWTNEMWVEKIIIFPLQWEKQSLTQDCSINPGHKMKITWSRVTASQLWACNTGKKGMLLCATETWESFSSAACPGWSNSNSGVSQSFSSLSHVRLFATLWTAAHQASLSMTNSQSLLKLMSIDLVMPSNRLILCHPLLLPPSIFASIRVFSDESVLHIKWPKY